MSKRGSFVAKRGYFFLQQPLVHSEGATATALGDLSAQQLAAQAFARSEQQSQAQVSHAQTPDAQQQLPLGQQFTHAHTVETVVVLDLLA